MNLFKNKRVDDLTRRVELLETMVKTAVHVSEFKALQKRYVALTKYLGAEEANSFFTGVQDAFSYYVPHSHMFNCRCGETHLTGCDAKPKGKKR